MPLHIHRSTRKTAITYMYNSTRHVERYSQTDWMRLGDIYSHLIIERLPKVADLYLKSQRKSNGAEGIWRE